MHRAAKNLCCWCTPPPSWGWTVWLCLLVEALVLCPLGDLFIYLSFIFTSVKFFFFYHFLFASLHILLMILLFKMASRSNAEVPPSVPKHRKPWCALWRRYGCRYTSFTQAMVLLAMKSMLVNHRYVLNKMSSHRNIHKTRLWTDQRLVGTDPCISPRRNSSVFPNSIFSASL